VPSKTFV
ncbi:protein kinase C-binding protein 1, partial [Trichonephila inaurata madagascariensis]